MNRVMVLAAMAGCSWVPCGKPDAISPLAGRELVAKKVKLLVAAEEAK